MNRAQIKQLNKRVDEMLRVKKLPSIVEMGMPIELIRKYDLTRTKTLK